LRTQLGNPGILFLMMARGKHDDAVEAVAVVELRRLTALTTRWMNAIAFWSITAARTSLGLAGLVVRGATPARWRPATAG
jgi:hypothetical protein